MKNDEYKYLLIRRIVLFGLIAFASGILAVILAFDMVPKIGTVGIVCAVWFTLITLCSGAYAIKSGLDLRDAIIYGEREE